MDCREGPETPELCMFLQPLSRWLHNSVPAPAVLYSSCCGAVTHQHAQQAPASRRGDPTSASRAVPALPTPLLKFNMDHFSYCVAKY